VRRRRSTPPSRNAEFKGSFAENLNPLALLHRLGACAPVSAAVALRYIYIGAMGDPESCP
jgi:hypothetical protein